MHNRHFCVLLFVIAFAAPIGCTADTSHEKFDWHAEDYFDDPQVIALCEAIEAEDLLEIDRLVAAGADVNAKGKGNMTPLLWAYPDNKLARFKRLLEHGADPNVIFESDFSSRASGVRPGDSITHMVCKTSFPGYFEAVFENGGDVNLVNGGKGNITETPIFKLITGGGGVGRVAKIKLLIEKGADLDYVNGAGATPSMTAALRGGQYDLTLMLLREGADHRVYKPRSNSRLIHTLVREKLRREQQWPPQQQAAFEEVVAWLEGHGESFAKAEKDVKRWHSWLMSGDNSDYSRKLDAEVAQRKARDAQARAKAKQDNDQPPPNE